MQKAKLNIGLEIAKFFYTLLVGGMIFLFFCLSLDSFCWIVAGGWNTFLGAWPIFSGTVSVLVYGSWGAVLFLLACYGLICRIVLWDSIPTLLEFLLKPQSENAV